MERHSRLDKHMALLHLPWQTLLLFPAMAVVTGLLAGSYPALYLSSFNPASVLRGALEAPPHERAPAAGAGGVPVRPLDPPPHRHRLPPGRAHPPQGARPRRGEPGLPAARRRPASANFIVNEQAAKAMGVDEPVGQRLAFWDREGTIIGVVKDFNMASLYETIEPTIIRLDPEETGMLFVRTRPGETPQAPAGLQTVTASKTMVLLK